jgi:hypothetical protein
LHRLFLLDECHVYVFVFDRHWLIPEDFHVGLDASQVFCLELKFEIILEINKKKRIYLVEDVMRLMLHFHVKIFLDKLILKLHIDQLYAHLPNLINQINQNQNLHLFKPSGQFS